MDVTIHFTAWDPPQGRIEVRGAQIADEFTGWLGLLQTLGRLSEAGGAAPL